MLETLQSHFRLSDLNASLGLFLLFTLLSDHRPPLVWHDWLSGFNFSQFFFCDNPFSLCQWNFRDSHTFSLLYTRFESTIINLLIEWWVITAFCVNVVCQQILSIVYTTNSWVYIAFTIGMECWFAEIGCER